MLSFAIRVMAGDAALDQQDLLDIVGLVGFGGVLTSDHQSGDSYE
jgi:hypothetical protein